MILFCSTQDIDSSRTRVLINLLNSNFNFKTFNFQRKSNSIFKIVFIFFKWIFKLNPKLIILGFNSRLLIIPVLIFKKILKTKVIYDIGYPITDIPDFNIFKRKIFDFLDFIAVKNFDLIILESAEQVKFYKKFKVNKLVMFSYIEFGNYTQSSNLNFSNYFLFRGRLNEESGILESINFFNKYKKHGKSKLVIHGWGKLLENVKKMIQKSPRNIILIDNFLDEVEMTNLIANSKALIGQSKKNCLRLQKTIPHKCFEAIFFEKPYLSYLYEPIYEIFGKNYKKFDLQLDFDRSNFESLFHKIDMMDSFDLHETAKYVKKSFKLRSKNQKNKLIKYIDEVTKN